MAHQRKPREAAVELVVTSTGPNQELIKTKTLEVIRLHDIVRATLVGLSHLVDIGPTELVQLDESTDWGLVGGDLREAANALAPTDKDSSETSPSPLTTHELVEG